MVGRRARINRASPATPAVGNLGAASACLGGGALARSPRQNDRGPAFAKAFRGAARCRSSSPGLRGHLDLLAIRQTSLVLFLPASRLGSKKQPASPPLRLARGAAGGCDRESSILAPIPAPSGAVGGAIQMHLIALDGRLTRCFRGIAKPVTGSSRAHEGHSTAPVFTSLPVRPTPRRCRASTGKMAAPGGLALRPAPRSSARTIAASAPRARAASRAAKDRPRRIAQGAFPAHWCPPGSVCGSERGGTNIK